MGRWLEEVRKSGGEKSARTSSKRTAKTDKTHYADRFRKKTNQKATAKTDKTTKPFVFTPRVGGISPEERPAHARRALAESTKLKEVVRISSDGRFDKDH